MPRPQSLWWQRGSAARSRDDGGDLSYVGPRPSDGTREIARGTAEEALPSRRREGPRSGSAPGPYVEAQNPVRPCGDHRRSDRVRRRPAVHDAPRSPSADQGGTTEPPDGGREARCGSREAPLDSSSAWIPASGVAPDDIHVDRGLLHGVGKTFLSLRLILDTHYRSEERSLTRRLSSVVPAIPNPRSAGTRKL